MQRRRSARLGNRLSRTINIPRKRPAGLTHITSYPGVYTREVLTRYQRVRWTGIYRGCKNIIQYRKIRSGRDEDRIGFSAADAGLTGVLYCRSADGARVRSVALYISSRLVSTFAIKIV